MRETIGQRLQRTRLALGYATQKAFADAGGFTPVRYNQWEKDAERPSLEGALQLCERFHLSLDWLYLGLSGNLPQALVDKLTTQSRPGEPPASSRRVSLRALSRS